ncbi:MAG: hypothetical protein EOP87_23370, partial [Verrucomicrobiaceae bacterium]
MKPNLTPGLPPRQSPRVFSSWWKPATGVSAVLLAYLLLAASAIRSSRSGSMADIPDPVRKSQRVRSTVDLPDQLVSALSTGKPQDRDRALQGLLPELMRRDISAAARMAEGLEPWAAREDILFRVAREWAS